MKVETGYLYHIKDEFFDSCYSLDFRPSKVVIYFFFLCYFKVLFKYVFLEIHVLMCEISVDVCNL